jgi:class 3 adenylate cyclase
MGVESHWDLFLGVCVFVSFYIFPESQRRWMVFVILVCSLCFLGVNFGLLAHGLLPDLPLAFVRAETFFNLAGFLFCAISMGAVGYVVINRAEGNLVREHERSEMLLHNILPIPIAQRLKKNPGTIADGFEEATILFADIVGFTSYTENVAPDKLVDLLNTIFSEFDNLTDKYGVEKIKTIGDAYVVAAGVPALCANHAEVLADMALEMQGVISNFNARTGQSLKIRIGIHSGSVIAGVIGKKKFAYDLWGDSVNTAARMESHGVPGEIQVTETTYQLLQPKYRLEEREVIDVKGKGPMCTYLLKGRL